MSIRGDRRDEEDDDELVSVIVSRIGAACGTGQDLDDVLHIPFRDAIWLDDDVLTRKAEDDGEQ